MLSSWMRVTSISVPVDVGRKTHGVWYSVFDCTGKRQVREALLCYYCLGLPIPRAGVICLPSSASWIQRYWVRVLQPLTRSTAFTARGLGSTSSYGTEISRGLSGFFASTPQSVL